MKASKAKSEGTKTLVLHCFTFTHGLCRHDGLVVSGHGYIKGIDRLTRALL